MSVLNCTHEVEKDNRLAFLDCLSTKLDNRIITSVYVKETSGSDCLNYKSVCPQRYKTGLIKTLLHRGWTVSHNWETFQIEVRRIKQLLTDNDFPMKVIDAEVDKFIRGRRSMTSDANTEVHNGSPDATVKLYFRNQMTTSYKTDESKLHELVRRHLKPVAENTKVKLCIYYKTRKLQSLFVKNKSDEAGQQDPNLRHHVVYQYTCNKQGCNSLRYIGYTTCSLHERFRMHTQTGSIIKHLKETHRENRVPRSELLAQAKVIDFCNEKRRLIFLEAIYIKTERPELNSQTEGSDRILKIFVH